MPNQPSTSAKSLYRPVGLISSVPGGVIAGTIFEQVWKRAAPGPKTIHPAGQKCHRDVWVCTMRSDRWSHGTLLFDPQHCEQVRCGVLLPGRVVPARSVQVWCRRG